MQHPCDNVMWVMPGTRLGHVNFFKIEGIDSDDQDDDHLFDAGQYEKEGEDDEEDEEGEEEEEEEEEEQQEGPCSSRSKPTTPPVIGTTVLLEDGFTGIVRAISTDGTQSPSYTIQRINGSHELFNISQAKFLTLESRRRSSRATAPPAPHIPMERGAVRSKPSKRKKAGSRSTAGAKRGRGGHV